MDASKKLNLKFLRKSFRASRCASGSADVKTPGGGAVSRRTFLALSASGATLHAIPSAFLAPGFRVRERAGVVSVFVGEDERWTIDPRFFGKKAKAAVTRSSGQIHIELTRAYFAGTKIPADFRCVFRRSTRDWDVQIAFNDEQVFRAGAMPWLLGMEKAAAEFSSHTLRPFRGFGIKLLQTVQAELSPDWELVLAGPMSIELAAVEQRLESSICKIQLRGVSELAAETGLAATSFTFERGGARWPISLERTSAQGWSLQHGPPGEHFSVLRVEAVRGVRTAAFLPSYEEKAPGLSLLPAADLLGDTGDQFALPLQHPRLAFTLGRRITSALIADIEETGTWAHGIGASYLLSGHGGGVDGEPRRFELLEDCSDPQPSITAHPAVSQVAVPFEDAFATLVMHEPRSILPDLTAPFERLWGLLGGMPSEHHSPFALLDEDELHLERPADFLSLKFRFSGMHLVAGLRPRVKVMKADAFITVIFPPQHVSEEAAFHSDDPGGNCSQNFEEQETAGGKLGCTYRNPTIDPLTKSYDLNKAMQSLLAGESWLRFQRRRSVKTTIGKPYSSYRMLPRSYA